eukprot:SAG11_NODE_1978_length_3972_cov_45.154144_4_plen_436_part_00
MSVYPRNLSNFLNRLSGYNKNNVKLTVLGSDTANQGDIIQVDLPSNSIVDLSSLAWSFQVVYGTQGGTGVMAPPINCEGLISRLAVEVNGQTLVNLTNYNDLFHLLLNMTATEDHQRQRMVAQSNVAATAAATPTSNGTTQALVAADAGAASTRRHTVDTWLGFLGSAKPNFIDTSLLGNVRISITLAPGDILGGSTANANNNRTYAVSDQAFSIDVISIGDGIYDSMVDQMLASGRPIEIPFKNYFCYTNLVANMGQTTLFNVASQSIDRLWGTARLQTYSSGNLDQEAVGSVPDRALSVIKTTPNYFTFKGDTGRHYQFQVNNTLYPNWQLNTADKLFQHTKLAIGDQGNMLSGSVPISAKMYMENFFAFAVSLEHHTDSDERFLSGIDTRGSSANCYFKSDDNGGAASQILVFAECTSSLKIMANKVLEIVQ